MFPPGFGEVAERLRRSTVHISAGGRGHGSGIIVKSEGTIVTNAHVARFGRLAVTLWDGRSFPAEIATRDLRRDLAILRVPASNVPAAPLGDSNQLRPGELVIAIGNPLGFMGALTAGIIHAVGPLPGLGPRKWIQAGVRLAPGNSGGPLADASGNVVGVNTMVAGRLGLAVPSNEVSRLLRGENPQPLGVTLRPMRVAAAGRELLGLMILELAPDGAASRASLLPGDILVGADGRFFSALEDLEDALQANSGRVLRLQFVRGDPSKMRSVAIQLGVSTSVAA
ncbi:MAG: peptidase S1 [Acidobacteria bacterium]|nr:MAG: peptidase S1 [Acidobacteriota bacterium]